MNMLSDLVGKKVLITGSSTGIGAAVAVGLAKLGAHVAVHARNNAESAQRVVSQIEDAGGRATLIIADLTSLDGCEAVVRAAVAELGGLQVLINNAGAMGQRVSNADFDPSVYESVFELNVRSVLAVTKAAHSHIKAAGGGSIVNTGSVVGRSGGYRGSTVYAASKAAVHSITRNAAREFAADGIRVNTIAPGFIVTPFHAETPDDVRQQVASQIPMQRVGSTDDCVGAYAFLSSDMMSGYITGQIIDINGGQFMA